MSSQYEIYHVPAPIGNLNNEVALAKFHELRKLGYSLEAAFDGAKPLNNKETS